MGYVRMRKRVYRICVYKDGHMRGYIKGISDTYFKLTSYKNISKKFKDLDNVFGAIDDLSIYVDKGYSFVVDGL